MRTLNEAKDLTFVIPIRVDSIIRLENLLAVICYIRKYFKTNIVVLEAASYNNKLLSVLLKKDVKFVFVEDHDPIFHRTHYINLILSHINTKYVAVWDADVIIPPGQVRDALEVLRLDNADVVYPYDGRFFDVSEIIRKLYIKNACLDIFTQNINKMEAIYGVKMLGGAFMINSEKYKAAGGENENFYGWGIEDLERYRRWISYGYRVDRIIGCLFHLTHPRDLNGTFNSSQQRANFYYELSVISAGTKKEIKNHLKENKWE